SIGETPDQEPCVRGCRGLDTSPRTRGVLAVGAIKSLQNSATERSHPYLRQLDAAASRWGIPHQDRGLCHKRPFTVRRPRRGSTPARSASRTPAPNEG